MRAVNLIPGEQRQGAGGMTGRSGGGALILLGLIAGIAVLVAMYGSAHHRLSSQAGEVASINAQTSAIQARTGSLAAYTSFVAMAGQRTQTVAQLVQARFDWSHALHEFGRVLPAGTSLSSLHGAVGASAAATTTSSAPSPGAGSTASSSTPPGSTPAFTLTGCSTSQSQVAQALQRLRLIDGVTEVQLQSSTKSGGGGAGAGSCPPGDPAFTAQVTFTGLPATPALAPSSAAGTTAPAIASHGAGKHRTVSAHGKGARR